MSASGIRRGLFIGIDDYPNFSPLAGCVNDARAMRALLEHRFGFRAEHQQLLINDEATQAGIRAALAHLLDATQPDDIVVLQFAGHGSQMTDVEGDEPDGMDETIVAFDSGRDPHPNRDIKDDEINEWLQQLTAKTPFVTLIFDCCHSGTVTRDGFGVRSRSAPADTRRPDQLPPSPLQGGASTRSAAERGPSGWLALSERYTLIAGCADREESYEYRDHENGVDHGALSYFLMQELQQLGPGATYRDVFAPVAAKVTANAWQQHPQIEGKLDREVFGIGEFQPQALVSVVAQGDRAALSAGAALGVTVGSEWALYAPGQKAEAAAPVLATARVVNVAVTQAELDLDAALVKPGVRALQIGAEQRFGLAVAVVADTGLEAKAEPLRKAVAASHLLHLADSAATGDVLVRLLDARAGDDPSAPAPQLGALDEATWVVLGQDGRLLAPARELSLPQPTGTVVENLEKIARYRNAMALDNPDASLRDKLRVEGFVRRPGESWRPLQSSHQLVIDEGEEIQFRLQNTADRVLHVSLLDFDYVFGVDPMLSAPLELEPGSAFVLGENEGWGAMEMLETFPFVQQPDDFDSAVGEGAFKFFVTTEPADFAPLWQQAVRAAGDASEGLEALIAAAGGHRPVRKIRKKTGYRATDWTTVTIPYQMRRAGAGATNVMLADGRPVQTTAGLVLSTPDRAGAIAVLESPAELADPLLEALRAQQIAPGAGVQLRQSRTRSTRVGTVPKAIQVDVPVAEPDQIQVLLSRDAGGLVRWHFAEAAPVVATRSLNPGPARRFFIRPRLSQAPATRGIVGAAAKYVLQEYVFPLVEESLGEIVGDYFVGRWEARNRPYGVRPLSPDNYAVPAPSAMTPEFWQHLAGGRSLLFVHGTFARAHTTFAGLGEAVMRKLHDRYEGRVFAFDHPSVSESPKANVEYLLRAMQEQGVDLDVDIVCHSRGGLVSRTLVERQAALAFERRIAVGQVVFVGAPNAGTALADPEHMGDLVDCYTNLMTLLPDNPITDLLDPVISTVKQLAVGAMKGLDGLQSMNPGGEFQRWLNTADHRGPTRYRALAAQYEPQDPKFFDYAKDFLMDRVFQDEHNDLVVPTASAFEVPGSANFPADEKRVYGAASRIAHTNFFGAPEVTEDLLAWLTP